MTKYGIAIIAVAVALALLKAKAYWGAIIFIVSFLLFGWLG